MTVRMHECGACCCCCCKTYETYYVYSSYHSFTARVSCNAQLVTDHVHNYTSAAVKPGCHVALKPNSEVHPQTQAPAGLYMFIAVALVQALYTLNRLHGDLHGSASPLQHMTDTPCSPASLLRHAAWLSQQLRVPVCL
jgi:hypothetical protein